MRDFPKCGNWNCSNVEKRYVLAYFYEAELLQLAICYLQDDWAR